MRLRPLAALIAPSRIALAGIAALSLYLGLARISEQGFSNYYYAAAVRSMMQNWHAFYFVSLDPKGFVSVDKPPVGFWIQTAFALIFGFHGWAVLLPEALAAACSTLVLYAIVRPFFGVAAGLIAALALAVSPINVAVARNNTPDGLLVFTLLLAALCFSRAIRGGRFAWLAASFALVGVGFNIKMLEAYLILPAFVVAYVLVARISLWRRILQLALASAILAVVSFSWAFTVWLTPANQRPYVGSTRNNDIFSLIFGYNGLNRLLPRGWSIFGLTNGSRATNATIRGGIGGGRLTETGAQGFLRLFDHQLAGQVGWLIPIALIGFLVAWGRPRWRPTDQQILLVMFGAWAAIEIAFFSLAGFFHRYYLATLSPELAALTGIGIVALWRCSRSPAWRPWALPAAFALAAFTQWRILEPYDAWDRRLDPLLLVAGALAAVLTIARLAIPERGSHRAHRASSGVSLAAAACLLALLAAPAIWSYTTLADGYFGALPAAGPSLTTNATTGSRQSRSSGQAASLSALAQASDARAAVAAAPPRLSQANKTMIAFLEQHRGHETYLVAVPASVESAPIILATGEPVMTLGGFSGSDPILTVPELQRLIATHQVRFFLDLGMSADVGASLHAVATQLAETTHHHSSSHETISTWVEQNCVLVPPETISAATPGSSPVGLNGLFDCKAYAH